jgi:hypothetical protein
MSKSCLDQLEVWGPEYGHVYYLNLYLDFVISSNLMKLSNTELLMVFIHAPKNLHDSLNLAQNAIYRYNTSIKKLL